MSNFLTETGLRIHSPSVLGNTETAFQTAVILQIQVLRNIKRGSVIFMKISKRFEAKAQIIPHSNQEDTNQKIGNNYLLVFEIN